MALVVEPGGLDVATSCPREGSSGASAQVVWVRSAGPAHTADVGPSHSANGPRLRRAQPAGRFQKDQYIKSQVAIRVSSKGFLRPSLSPFDFDTAFAALDQYGNLVMASLHSPTGRR